MSSGTDESRRLARFLDAIKEGADADVDPDVGPVPNFQVIYDSDAHYFAIGAELTHGLGYISFPVSTGLVDYEEYYALTDDEFERFRVDPELALPLLEQCRRREQDHRLMQQPVSNRGTPV